MMQMWADYIDAIASQANLGARAAKGTDILGARAAKGIDIISVRAKCCIAVCNRGAAFSWPR